MTAAPTPSSPNPTPKVPAPEQRRSLSGKTITALILLAISLAFIFSNLNQGTIMFLGFRFVMPVWIWFLGVLVMGVVIGSLFPWFRGRRKKK